MVDEKINFKTTLKKPINKQSKNFEKNFKKTMDKHNLMLNEIDDSLNENEKSLKKKIFKLDKMESLVFSDPKLSAVYNKMSEDGEYKYGYHSNETIMNMIFNDYVLNSQKYLQKYKKAIPSKKKRRDKSGIKQAQKAGEEKMQKKNIDEYVDNIDQPDDEDCVIQSDGFKYSVNCGSEFINDFENMDDALTAVKEWKVENNFYPDTWFISDHGNASLIDDDGNFVDTDIEQEDEVIGETTTAGSAAGGSSSYVGYAGPSAWSKTGKPAMKKPIYTGGSVIAESNYLIDTSGFEEYLNEMNKEDDIEFITKKSKVYNDDDLNNMNDQNIQIIKNDLKTRKLDEEAKSKQQQKFMGMVRSVQKGETKPSEVSKSVRKAAKEMKPEDVKDFASTKHDDLPEKVTEESQTMIGDNPSSMALTPTPNDNSNMQRGLDMNEDIKNLNEELDEIIEQHNDLVGVTKDDMNEERKPSSLVNVNRLGKDNSKNFKNDLKHSGTKEVINIEKELQYRDQQTDIGKNPYKNGEDIEKDVLKRTKGQALKNVGNSANEKGDEIVKRNLTDDENNEVHKYRKGQGDWIFDNKPDNRFEERMKADMGEELYKQREEKIEFAAQAPMYNKDTQPIDDGIKKDQFDKNVSGWNDREGIKESRITGKYTNLLNKTTLIDFKLDEVQELNSDDEEGIFQIDFTAMGNTLNNKGQINEDIVNIIENNQFYTDGELIFVKKEKKIINEVVDEKSFNKMKHLYGYNPKSYVDTKSIKNKRGF